MVQIFILTHNRSNLLVNAIDSVLRQKQLDFSYEIIISDNSTNNETQRLVDEKYNNIPSLTYRKRLPMSWTQHVNTVMSEVTADFFMLFHDDDTMCPDMVKSLYDVIKNGNNLLAVGCNAHLVIKDRDSGLFFNKSSDIQIHNVDQLAIAYLTYSHAPFPSYMYRKFVAKNFQLNIKNGGKYCDVSFLLDIATKGNVIMLREPLMNYYLHENQISTGNEFDQQDSLIRYILKVSSFTKESPLIKQYRTMKFYQKISSLNKLVSSYRWIKVRNIFFKYSPFFLFPRIILKRVLKRI